MAIRLGYPASVFIKAMINVFKSDIDHGAYKDTASCIMELTETLAKYADI